MLKNRLTNIFKNYKIIKNGVIMNLKQFEYLNKDIPFLKKDIAFRLFFALVYFAVFVWQFASVTIKSIHNSITTPMIVSTVAVLVICLLFVGLSLMYCFKSFKILGVVKKKGRCISRVEILFNTEKKGFVKLYSYITEFLTIICSIVLLCSAIYTMLEIAYISSISYYMPVLATICCGGFYSAYHINTEINIVKNVQMYNSIY